MTWSEYHSSSESLASDARELLRKGDRTEAEDLYRKAAEAETTALGFVPIEKQRTRGITAVSAVALWYKGHDFTRSEEVALAELNRRGIPDFARRQLQELLQMIWSVRSAEAAGVRFLPGDVMVSVKGGQVIHGGAPLDMILQKVEGIQATLFRTVEMLLKRPFRTRGGPSADILSMFCPWLFQAPAGSYQFAVRVQEPQQRELWEAERPTVERVTSTFLRVLHATSTSPGDELPRIVADPDYRSAFLKLSRNLAPTGKSFERLEVRDASAPSEPAVTLGEQSRKSINAVVKKAKEAKASPADEEIAMRGILRAVHLDQDWIELYVSDRDPSHVKIFEAGDALDDVVGPMVNRRVIVEVVKRSGKLLYRDIELDE